jgi:hypothetical protein
MQNSRLRSPLGAVAGGIVAGVLGTAAMTAWQTAAAKLRSSEPSESQAEEPKDPWEQASAPAKLAKRIGEGVFHREVSADLIPLLTNAMHWGYGTGWGAVYAIATTGRRRSTIRRGAAFGAIMWASSYAQLVPIGLYAPPWTYEPQELALDLSYHLVYGTGVALALKTIDR